MTRHPDKIAENKLRRIADRRGLTLKKSPRRDSKALDYGTYKLIIETEDADGKHEHEWRAGLRFDQIEAALDEYSAQEDAATPDDPRTEENDPCAD